MNVIILRTCQFEIIKKRILLKNVIMATILLDPANLSNPTADGAATHIIPSNYYFVPLLDYHHPLFPSAACSPFIGYNSDYMQSGGEALDKLMPVEFPRSL